jgi:hypothetical protein
VCVGTEQWSKQHPRRGLDTHTHNRPQRRTGERPPPRAPRPRFCSLARQTRPGGLFVAWLEQDVGGLPAFERSTWVGSHFFGGGEGVREWVAAAVEVDIDHKQEQSRGGRGGGFLLLPRTFEPGMGGALLDGSPCRAAAADEKDQRLGSMIDRGRAAGCDEVCKRECKPNQDIESNNHGRAESREISKANTHTTDRPDGYQLSANLRGLSLDLSTRSPEPRNRTPAAAFSPHPLCLLACFRSILSTN